MRIAGKGIGCVMGVVGFFKKRRRVAWARVGDAVAMVLLFKLLRTEYYA